MVSQLAATREDNNFAEAVANYPTSTVWMNPDCTLRIFPGSISSNARQLSHRFRCNVRGTMPVEPVTFYKGRMSVATHGKPIFTIATTIGLERGEHEGVGTMGNNLI